LSDNGLFDGYKFNLPESEKFAIFTNFTANNQALFDENHLI
jgi:hypothetical protein